MFAELLQVRLTAERCVNNSEIQANSKSFEAFIIKNYARINLTRQRQLFTVGSNAVMC